MLSPGQVLLPLAPGRQCAPEKPCGPLSHNDASATNACLCHNRYSIACMPRWCARLPARASEEAYASWWYLFLTKMYACCISCIIITVMVAANRHSVDAQPKLWHGLAPSEPSEAVAAARAAVPEVHDGVRCGTVCGAVCCNTSATQHSYTASAGLSVARVAAGRGLVVTAEKTTGESRAITRHAYRGVGVWPPTLPRPKP